MITVGQATAIIFDHLYQPGTTRLSIEGVSGRALAEKVVADRDFPPFHRVAMDGIAICYDAWGRGQRTFPVQETQAAGESPKQLLDPGYCIEVMTGAVLPSGCDVVIRYEDLEIADQRATVRIGDIEQWQSVHRQAADARQGEVLLDPGFRIGPSEVALMASVGKSNVAVFSTPKVAIISTGNELVAIDAIPSPFQVRRSNAFAIQSALQEAGCQASCFHLMDEKTSMQEKLKGILAEHDVLILSGGVSKGKFDFVPEVLETLGIRKLFHQVSQRPGKPFWFGASGSGKVAFALPGNPVSTFMCFYRYVKPWLLRSLGITPDESFATLGTDFSFPGALTYFLQVEVKNVGGTLVAMPQPGGGSGDFANLKNVNGFLELPLEKKDFRAGESFPLISFRD